MASHVQEQRRCQMSFPSPDPRPPGEKTTTSYKNQNSTDPPYLTCLHQAISLLVPFPQKISTNLSHHTHLHYCARPQFWQQWGAGLISQPECLTPCCPQKAIRASAGNETEAKRGQDSTAKHTQYKGHTPWSAILGNRKHCTARH